MLTIGECRKIMEEYQIELTDEEIATIRDWLYYTVDIVIEIVEKRKPE